jgi:hypothetical protein
MGEHHRLPVAVLTYRTCSDAEHLPLKEEEMSRAKDHFHYSFLIYPIIFSL